MCGSGRSSGSGSVMLSLFLLLTRSGATPARVLPSERKVGIKGHGPEFSFPSAT